jgi:hypothetical protein
LYVHNKTFFIVTVGHKMELSTHDRIFRQLMEDYKKDVIRLDQMIQQKKYKLVLEYIMRSVVFKSGNYIFLEARCWAALSNFKKALKLLNSMPLSAENADSYWWFKYVLYRQMDDHIGASFVRQKFNPVSTMWLNAPLSEQLEHCITGRSDLMSIPVFLRLDRSPIAHSSGFLDMVVVGEGSDDDPVILRDPEADCRSVSFKRTKLKVIKLSRNGHTLPLQSFLRTSRIEDDMKAALAPVCWGMLILTGPYLHPDMVYDVELTALLACGQGTTDVHPLFDRIFNSSDLCAQQIRQDILVTRWDQRIHRVVANNMTKDLALELLKYFLQAPLMHKEVIFCGHGDADGNWVFRNGVISFDDFVAANNEWEPAHIVANCCNSKKWGDRWKIEILSQFKLPTHCGVRLTAVSENLAAMGGVLADTVCHVRDPNVLFNLQEILSTVVDGSDGRGGQIIKNPDEPAELDDIWDIIKTGRLASVLQLEPFPQGFPDSESFLKFCRVFLDNLNSIKITDATLSIQGSSVNGFKWMKKRGQGRLFDDYSDYDVGIISSVLYEIGVQEKIRVHDGANYPRLHAVCLRANDTAGPEDDENVVWALVGPMLRAVQDMANHHTVNFVVYPTFESAAHHTGASLVVKRYTEEYLDAILHGSLWYPRKRFLAYIPDESTLESAIAATALVV